MLWFKHFNDLSRDEGVSAYLDSSQDRYAAYGFLNLVLEIIAERMDFKHGDPKCCATFSKREWARLTNSHVNRVIKYLPHLGVIGWVSVEFDGSNYRVEIPKLLEWRDEYSRKSGGSQDKVVQNRTEEKRPEQRESNSALSESQQERVPVDRSQQDFILTPDRRAWAEARRPDIDIDLETEKFRVYPFKRPPSKPEAAWKKWILDARPASTNRASGTIVHDTRRQLLEMGPLLGIKQGPDEPEAAYLARVKCANDKRIASMDS